MILRLFVLWIVCAAFAGCATNPRFADDTLPASHITGEKVCEVPQHWKALALQGVNTKTLEKASVVQVRVPPEWVGDALGWFVEGEETRTMEQYPRYIWQALVINERTGKKQFFSAIMKNPLISPVLTVIITDPEIRGGEELNVYVLSGAYTKLLTVSGDMLQLPSGKDCLGLVDAEFLRMFPSKARAVEVRDTGAGAGLLAGIRGDFPTPTLQSDGQVYSLNSMALNRKVAGDLRQVTPKERLAESGVKIPFPPEPVTLGILGVQVLYNANNEKYAGPFGERLYSAGEANAALKRYLRGYNALKGDLEIRLGVTPSESVSFDLDFSGRKSGWEIGEGLAWRVQELWQQLNPLKERVQSRTNGKKGGAVQEEVVRFGLLPSSSPP